MKDFFKIILLAFAVLLVSCTNNGKVLIEGTVVKIDEYGGLKPSFSPEEMEAAGVEYGDLLTVSIGDSITVFAPYVDAYTEAGSMSPCLCNYNRGNSEVTASMSNGSFAGHVGGNVGDAFIVKMKKKKGCLDEYTLLQGTYSYELEDYESVEAFANFRPLKTIGIKHGVLYRSTSPINFRKNRVRYKYSAILCQKNGIKTIVDIADTDEKIAEFLAAEESAGSYMQECYKNGNVIGLGSNADYLAPAYMEKVARAVREMNSRPAPYLIHCNEGKDRTGFYCLLIEALCGAPVQQMKEDYMQTFENLYHQHKDTEQYELTWTKNGFRMLYQIANPQVWTDVISIDWDNASLEGADLQKAAENYLLASGLSLEEISAFKDKIAVSF